MEIIQSSKHICSLSGQNDMNTQSQGCATGLFVLSGVTNIADGILTPASSSTTHITSLKMDDLYLSKDPSLRVQLQLDLSAYPKSQWYPSSQLKNTTWPTSNFNFYWLLARPRSLGIFHCGALEFTH